MSSCAKVCNLATEKKAEMVAAMESRDMRAPDLNDWFYKVPGEARLAATFFRVRAAVEEEGAEASVAEERG